MTRCFSFVVFCLLAIGTSALATDIFQTNATWKYFKGTSEASSPDIGAWREISFDDSAWSTGQAAFFYENNPGNPTEYFGNTQLSDMFGGYICIFLRKTIVLTNVADVDSLQFGAISDDGYIAWINGVEINRYNMPGGVVSYNGTSLPALAEPLPFVITTLLNPHAYLVPGTNVIAVQAFNASLSGSSDFLFNASLTYTSDTTPPTVIDLIPPATATVRSLTQIEITFSEPVAGVDAGDLLINGSPAGDVTALAPDQYLFSFTQPANGTVQVAWSAGNGIHDLASTPNNFAGGNWSYVLDPNAPLPGVLINEFMAANKITLHDEDGDNSDWIELYNSSAATVTLKDWFLTDDAMTPAKWRFPNVSLAPNAYLVVFASNKDRTNALGQLHTNFKLGSTGGYLGLYDAMTNVISDFAPGYPPQQTDVSYGHDRTDPSVLGYFTVPTPGAANSTRGAGFAPPVQFSRDSSTFTGSFGLTLATTSTNAEIRYTLDGSSPTNTSLLYAGPINISNSVLVRARAYQVGLLPGESRSESYLALAADVLTRSSDLPLLIIHNFGAGAFNQTAPKAAVMSFFETGYTVSSLTNTPNLSTRASLHIRGSSTAGYPKQSWAVEFWDEFNSDKNHSPLGLPSESDWVLYAPNNFEPVLMHNPMAYELSREMGRYASRTRFVEVYLNTSGGQVSAANYNGIYVLEEKIKIGKDRVAIDKLQPENLTPPSVTGGYILKIDRLGPGESGLNAAGQLIVYVDPSEPDIKLPQRAPQQSYIQSYMNAFGTALNGASYTDPTNGYAAYADVDSWIDHHIQNVLTFNVDALRLSAFFYKERNGKIHFGPVWDYDRTQGSTDGRDYNPRTWQSRVGDTGTDFFNYPWWGRMFTDPDFWQKWIDRYESLRMDKLSTNNINALIDGFASQVRNAQPREQSRWGVAPRSGTVTIDTYSYAFAGTYQGEVNFSKQWYKDRLNFMDTNLLAKPVFSGSGGPIPAGFVLTISGPAGATIYYTLDGTDPRLPGGSLSPKASVYSAPITLNNNARVVARARDLAHSNLTGPHNPPLSSPWSGVTAATFVVKTPPLVITELMYHPQPPPAGSPYLDEDFEYIELKNIGNTALSLVGFRFTNGIDFTFTSASGVTNLAAGGTVLVVKNRAAFVSRYGSLSNIAGEYQPGSLNNNGEQIYLEGPLKEPILDFAYDNKWYPITDGFGFSLVIVNENASLNTWGSKESWRPSGVLNGSPGLADPAPPNFPFVVVNEALTHTAPPSEVDAIELFNAGSTDADISGWLLTDDLQTPKKYRIPSNTVLPAGGFVVFTETNFNSGAPGSFALSSHGDSVYLFSADANTNLTGYVQGFDFGAAQHGVTFGRYVISTGEDHFVSQISNTLGAVNSGPKVGPVVISEIMYHPPDTIIGTNHVDNVDDEYIELQNITGGTVPLFDPAFQTNAWRLSNAVNYDFPTNVSIAAGARILVVSFDPFTNAAAVASFRSRNGVSNSVPVFGPFQGKLDNFIGSIELVLPDTPEPPTKPDAGFVPYVLVERVNYSNAAPWPTNADGFGSSLQRVNLAAYGNDPANWIAAPKTPGNPNGVGSPPAITSQPASQTVSPGANVTFNVTAVGDPPLRYQWWRDQTNALAAATNSSLTISNVQIALQGNYTVTVSNNINSVTSQVAVLTVRIPPVITAQPQDQIATAGSAAVFGVSASGSLPLSYEWFKGGVLVTNMTLNSSNASLNVSNVHPADNGAVYSVTVTNLAGSSGASDNAVLTVLFAPLLITQPTNQFVRPGSNAVFVVTATGNLPPNYQWLFNATNRLPDATNATFVLLNAQAVNAGGYSVVASNISGSVTSQVATLTLLLAPLIQTQPQSLTVSIGSNVTFSAAASGTAPLRYQWWFNQTTALPGATSSSLNVNNAQATNQGGYTLIVTNSYGAATSQVATLTILIPPAITAPPQNQTANAGDNASFSVSASGTLPLSYHWLKGGVGITNMILNASNATLTVNNVQPSDDGTLYSVTVTNVAGTTPQSSNALLTVLFAPSITLQPTNQLVRTGSNAVFTAAAAGNPAVGYQWWFNATNPVAGAANAVLTLTNAQVTNQGSYVLIASNTMGTATSQVATLTLLLAPMIITHPQGLTVSVGSNVLFAVTTSGTTPLSYQWRHDGANIAGATSSNLVVANVQPTNEGNYLVVVTNLFGSATSQIAILIVDSDRDGMPDSWELAHGLNPNVNDAGLDPDGDGMTNLQEYIAGTDPQKKQSALRLSAAIPSGSTNVQLSFDVVSNKTYTIQFRDSASTGVWQRLTDVIATPTNHTVVFPDTSGSAPSRVYRLATPQIP